MKTKVVHIAITGGPCGGKSICLKTLPQYLHNLGFQVFIVPEIPTLLVNSGLDLRAMAKRKNQKQWFELQRQIFRLQRSFHASCTQLALSSQKPSVIMSDRGELDVRAYLDEAEFFRLLKEEGISLKDLFAGWDLVIHLTSAALGAETYYDLKNPARFETLEEAREADKRTLAAWQGHPQLQIINNDGVDFETKLERVREVVLRAINPH